MESKVTELSEKKQGYKEARAKLKSLSAQVSTDVKNGKYQNINTAIYEEIYRAEGHTELKTFWDWKKEGKSVLKGAKALVLWGSPRKGKVKDATAEGTEGEEYDFWPIAYVFSNQQVA